MVFGYLKDDNNQIIFNDYNQGDTSTTLQHLVGGNIDYIPMSSILKKVPRELHNVSLVVNRDAKNLKECKPNLLVDEELVVGNIVFVRVDEDCRTLGLTEKQIEVLPIAINNLIITQDLKLVFGVC